MERSDFDTSVKFDEEFASGKTKEEIVLAINHFLTLHSSPKIDRFHLYFCASENFVQSIENWVSYVVGKGVEEIILDFSMGINDEECNDELKLSELPSALFACRTLGKLCLRRCIFSPPFGFVKFDILKSLSIEDVNIKSDELEKLISNCSVLENLRLANCISLDAIIVSSKSLLKLTIENSCCDYSDIWITTPNLKSFINYGNSFEDFDFISKHSFINISSLSDAFICTIETPEPVHNFVKLMYDLRHVEVLTVCTDTLFCIIYWDQMEHLPISMQNLKELQLLAHSSCCTNLEDMYGFFRLCPSPFIEKLFVQLSEYEGEELPVCLEYEVEDPLDVCFNHMEVVVIRNFLGCEGGMRLVSFLLEKAANLESMVLIMHSKFTEQKSMEIELSNNSISGAASREMNDLKSLHDEVLMLPKASARAGILLMEHEEGNTYWNPTHTEYFGES